MVSINNTSSNSVVLASIRQLNSDIATNQTRIGTGLKINKFSDNPALFMTAQNIRSEIKTQDSLSSTMSVAKARADSASAGLNKISEILTKISEISSSTSAASTASEVASANSKLTAYENQINSIIGASGFQGKNFLKNATAGYTESVKFSNSSATTLDYTGVIDVAAGTNVKALLDDTGTTLTGTAIGALTTKISNAIDEVSAMQRDIGSFSEMLGSQLDFQTTLKGINETALSSIVDANLEEESAKSTALQVKQQLAFQALSIGNSSAQNILRLFQ